jgi:hypothetical protein
VIHLVDQAMENLFRSVVPLPEGVIDVSFEAPDKAWSASINRPTVNLFLWEVKRDSRFPKAGIVERPADHGRVERRPTPPMVELRYFVTAWATQGSDEHRLLGSVLRCVLGNQVLPAAHIPAGLGADDAIILTLAASDKEKPGNFWSSLDGRLKPGLDVAVSLAVETDDWELSGPPAETLDVGANRLPSAVAAPVPATADPDRPRPHRAGGRLLMEGRRDRDAENS